MSTGKVTTRLLPCAAWPGIPGANRLTSIDRVTGAAGTAATLGVSVMSGFAVDRGTDVVCGATFNGPLHPIAPLTGAAPGDPYCRGITDAARR